MNTNMAVAVFSVLMCAWLTIVMPTAMAHDTIPIPYDVQSGDTILGIAKRQREEGLTKLSGREFWETVARLNNISMDALNRIYINQRILLPKPDEPTPQNPQGPQQTDEIPPSVVAALASAAVSEDSPATPPHQPEQNGQPLPNVGLGFRPVILVINLPDQLVNALIERLQKTDDRELFPQHNPYVQEWNMPVIKSDLLAPISAMPLWILFIAGVTIIGIGIMLASHTAKQNTPDDDQSPTELIMNKEQLTGAEVLKQEIKRLRAQHTRLVKEMAELKTTIAELKSELAGYAALLPSSIHYEFEGESCQLPVKGFEQLAAGRYEALLPTWCGIKKPIRFGNAFAHYRKCTPCKTGLTHHKTFDAITG